MTAEQLIEGFDPLINKIDTRILYEVTGRKMDKECYWDDSDQEPEVNPHVSLDSNKVSDVFKSFNLRSSHCIGQLSTLILIR